MVSQIQGLQFRQSQNMVMTPQLQLSLKVLQLSSMELSDFISSEVQKNPLLEFEENVEKPADSNDNTSENASEDGFSSDDNYDSYDSISSEKLNNSSEVLDSDNSSHADWSDDYSESNYTDYSANYDQDDAGSIIEKTMSEKLTLSEFLAEQVNLEFQNPIEKIIASNLVDMLDVNGYLSSETFDADVKNLAEQLNCTVEFVHGILARLKAFEPSGVFARNLKESLKIQLAEKDRLDKTIDIYIDNLELAAKGEITKLKKLCNCDEAELSEIIKEIKTLNPRPASNFSTENVQTRVIDVYLHSEFDENGNRKWVVELNNDSLPKILLNKTYYKEIKKKTKEDAQKKYLTENYVAANWLLRSLNQRAETTLKVASQLVEEQLEFFDKGINFLKPLKMRDIAEKLSIHESTVGRVVNGKFISTSRGVFELKYFFTSSVSGSIVSNSDGISFSGADDAVSSLTVKNFIKELIDNEDKSEILSDDAIAEQLNKKGINVARRTVAKYREAIGIPTSADRKRAARLNKKVK